MIEDMGMISCGEEPLSSGMLYLAELYDDRTNEKVIDFCQNADIKNIEAFEEMLPFISHDGCNRMFVRIDSYAEKERLYYRKADKWISIDHEKECFDLEMGDYKRYSGINVIDIKNDASLSGIESVIAFWQNRRAIRHALIELDPICISRYPLLQRGMTAYAKESYDIADRIRGISNEKEIVGIICSVLNDLDRVDLTGDEQVHLWSRLFRGEAWHVCPVCKSYYFHAEKDACPNCGWRNNLSQERNADVEVSTENTEPLRLRQAVYYLKKHDETRDEAEKIWSEYTDLFNALIKVKKAFPGEQSKYDNVFVFGVNINDGRYGEFRKLRENTMKRLEELLPKVKTENAAIRKNDDNQKRETQEIEDQAAYTELNHPGRDKCDELRKIRKAIADENGIDFQPAECHHAGPCKGTCPACEAEVKYLEEELQKKQAKGEKVKLAGIAEGYLEDY